jgi:hypothetical protein
VAFAATDGVQEALDAPEAHAVGSVREEAVVVVSR